MASNLLQSAARLYDGPDGTLRTAAYRAHGFAGGAAWMRLTLQVLRDERVSGGPPVDAARFRRLGMAKYGGCLLAAAGAGWIGSKLAGRRVGFLAAAVAFYAAEAQAVFLFPLALDAPGSMLATFRRARRLTVHAGGTPRVMATVLPLAARTLLGGFFRGGFRRSWCIGCLAVCVWYERVKNPS